MRGSESPFYKSQLWYLTTTDGDSLNLSCLVLLSINGVILVPVVVRTEGGLLCKARGTAPGTV